MKLLALCLSACLMLFSQSSWSQTMQPYGFIENQGQIHTQDNTTSPTRFVYTAQSGLNVQVHEGGFSYDAYQIIRDTLIVDPKTKKSRKLPRTYQFHRVDIDFPGSNPDVQIESLEAAQDYLVYYPADHPAGVRVRHHRKIIFHNLYQNIDLELLANPGTEKAFEYNFILHPGADLANIKIRYQGALKTHFHPDFLDLQLSMGSLRESIPASFWAESKQEVPLTYRLIEQDQQSEGSITVGFSGPSGALNQTLVIDPIPSLKWSTYFGSIGYDYGWDLEYDGKGQLYLCGAAQSTSNIATRGVHQSINNGDNDALIAKFDTTGQRIWASYFGGSRDDYAQNIELNSAGELIITGGTKSNDDIASPGAEMPQPNGKEDVFLAKFTTDGNRIWSRYWGGPDYDYVDALTTNQRGDIFIGGGTFSETGIAAPGQLQDRYSFLTDGFIARFSADGRYITSTYLGGGSDDGVNDLLCDDQDNIYVLGNTYSLNGVIPRNAYQNRNAGGADVMLWKLDSNFKIIWSTYCGGTGDDSGLSLSFDAQKNLYFTGATYSANYPLGSNAGLRELRGMYDAQVTKFSADGQLLWASYLGGFGHEYGFDLKLDPLGTGAIFVAGGSTESPGLVGSKAWQTEYGGGDADAFLAKLDDSGQLLWSTYYGGAGNDGFRAMEVDSSKNIYCLGYTSSREGMGTPNVQQNYYGGDGADLLLSSFKDCYAPLAPQNTTPATSLRICGGLRTTLKARGEGVIKWFDQPEGGRLLGEGDSLRTVPLFTTTTFYVQDSVCGRSRTRTAVTVQVDPRPDVNPGSPQTVCAGERVVVSGRGAIFYLWDGGAVNGIPFTPRETRTYTVVGTGGFGCRDTAQLLVTVLPRPEVSAGPDRRLCPGESLVLQGTGALRYTWDRGIVNGQRFVPPSGGTYTVIGQANNGCRDTASMTISLMSQPSVDAGPERRVCAGETLSLQGSGALTYEWDWGVKNAQPFQAIQSRLYTVIGIDANQCRDTAQVQVSVLPRPRISAGSDRVICEGEQIRLEGKGALTYTWNSGVIDNQLFRPLNTATYTLIGRDANNCADSAQVQVIVNPRPIVELPNTIGACTGETVTIEPRVSGGTGPYFYTWGGGFRGTSIQIQAQYNLELRLLITDQQRCEARDTAFIVVNAAPQVSINGPDSICTSDQAILERVINVGRPPYRYTWQDGQSTAQITVAPRETSTYTLIVEDGNGCRDTASYTLQVFATPDMRIDPGPDITICTGVPLVVKVSGADEYIWRGPGGFQGTGSSIYFRTPLEGRYDVIGSSTQGACSANTSFQIAVLPRVGAMIVGPSSICKGDSLVLASLQGGTFEWSTGEQTQEIRLKPTRSDTYRLVLTGYNQCMDTAYLSVNVNEQPEVSAGPDRQICAGDSLILQGSGALNYVWDGGLLGGRAFLPRSTQTYTVVGTNDEGCKDTAQVQVKVNPVPKLELPSTFELCAGGIVNIEPKASGGTGTFTYNWSNGSSEANIQFRAQNNSTLGLRIADGQGCETRGNVSILVNALPDLSITGPKQLCVGEKATLKKSIALGRAPYRYIWQDGQSTEQIEVTPQQTSTYNLIVQDANACRDTASYTLKVQAHPELTLLPEYKLKLGQSLKLIAGIQTGNYQWTPADGLSCTNCPDPELRTTQSGKYCVTVVSDGNCRSEACAEVTLDGKCLVYMPNVFSPNGDQINDTFCAYSPCIAEAQLWIYDRWGNLIFQSNPNETQPFWDGSSRGQAMDAGMYYYRLRGVDVLGQALDLQGTVSLLR